MQAALDDRDYNLVAAEFTGYRVEMVLDGQPPYWVFDREHIVVVLNERIAFAMLPEAIADTGQGIILAGRIATRVLVI